MNQINIGSHISVSGFVTDEKYLAGKNLQEIERRLGFQTGRLSKGASFIHLNSYPNINQFELRGYSQVADQHFTEKFDLTTLDLSKVKKNVIDTWKKSRTILVKVIPTTGHNVSLEPDKQYPPGSGIPQWKIIGQVFGTVVSNMQKDDYPVKPYTYLKYKL